MFNRRRFLSTASIFGLAAAGGTAARAFQLQEATPEQSSLYAAATACRQDSFHDQVIQELEAAMAGRPLPDVEKLELKQALSCPFCGCSFGKL